MNTLKRSVFIIVLLCLAAQAKAQFDAHFTYFREVENLYNPAAMNRDNRMDVTGSLSMQMSGYRHAPVTMYIGANTALPFDRMRHSAGVSLLNHLTLRLMFRG